MDYIDPLYGKLSLSQAEIDLIQTQELARLRDVSLSAVPSQMLPWGNVGSRFEHSIGVAHLAKIVAEKKAFSSISTDLVFAALLHDVGSPPFSHLTEVFLEDKLGKNHEQFAEEVLEGGGVFEVIKKHHGHPRIVLQLISGQQKSFGPLIAGTIDIDNLDNTLRFGIATGLIKRLYEPENLARAFGKDKQGLYLQGTVKRDIDGWEFCRHQVYAAVYSDANLAAATMLVRAIEFAFRHGDIDEDFFFQSDHQALYLLEHNCNPATRNLTIDARLWKHYLKAAEIITDKPNRYLKKYCHQKSLWGRLADLIAQELKINPEDVTIHTDKDKGYKQIDLPIKGEEIFMHQPKGQLRFMMQVYLHPRHQGLFTKTRTIFQKLLAGQLSL